MASSTGEEIALTVDETNKLREKLGLKPLQTDNDDSNGAAPGTGSMENDVLLAPVVPGAEEQANDLRGKIATQREKTEIRQKLAKVKTLGEADDDEDDAVAWVKKSRKLAKAKAEAAKQAQRLAEMDEAMEEDVFKERQHAYTAKDLKGMRIEHDMEAFQEGRQTILTLKDTGVLDDDADDVLENVIILDSEKAEQRKEEARKMGETHATAAIDDPLGLKHKGVLEKYDGIDQVTGDKGNGAQKKTSFRIGDKIDKAAVQTEEDIIREKLKNSVALETKANMIGSDFYTAEEMTKFKKKKKKKRKTRKTKALSADDLLNMPQQDDDEKPDDVQDMDMTADPQPLVDQDTLLDETEAVEDDMEVELQAALTRARMLKQKSSKPKRKDVVDRVEEAARVVKDEPTDGKEGLVFTAMTEFVRGVGTEDKAEERRRSTGAAAEPSQQSMDTAPEATTSLPSATVKQEPVDVSSANDILGSEGHVSSSLAEALKVAKRSGYLDTSQTQAKKAKTSKEASDSRDSRDSRSRGWGGSRLDPFEEKDRAYKPNFKIEYRDNEGRLLNEKDAFRMQSHVFHGHGSGRMKTEKRARKLKERDELERNSSTDSRSSVANMMNKRQKEMGTSHFVLSGTRTPALKK
eukprot:TRINITY_DN7581_c0_g1_i1.p1 TRINITY_DN7581_c0_g1~~TRINITY_DN7581_c0_g1_i1.p1  ORF type:complete len:654 (+),score=210.68 TRINITY_DN7581_c0_g1_i1:63-1964(+)